MHRSHHRAFRSWATCYWFVLAACGPAAALGAQTGSKLVARSVFARHSVHEDASADGSEKIRRWYGTQRGEQYGSALAILRDLDGDGADDLAIGAPRAGRRGFGPGRVEVRSGRTGAILWQRSGSESGDLFGEGLAAAGDVDGDGQEDLLVYARGADGDGEGCGEVYVLSGRDGSPIHRWSGHQDHCEFGASLSKAGDLDHDGYADIAIGAPAEGTIEVHSGRTGKILTTIRGETGDNRFGHRICRDGQRTGEGHPSLLATAPGHRKNRGALFRVDLRDGSTTLLAEGPEKGLRLGTSLALLEESRQTPVIVLGTETSREADPLFTVTDAKLRLLRGPNGRPASAKRVACGGDVDGDGHPDLLTVSPNGGAVLLRGLTGEALLSQGDPSGMTGLGRSMAIGDLDGDGFAEIALGQPFENGAGPAHGAVVLQDLGAEGRVPKSLRVGRPCSARHNRLPRIAIDGEPRLGTRIAFALRTAIPGAAATLLIGRPQTCDLAPFGIGGCELRIGPGATAIPIRTDKTGEAATDSVEIPIDPLLLGRTLAAQWVYKDGHKPSASDAMLLTFGR